jgi:hypothetical protein
LEKSTYKGQHVNKPPCDDKIVVVGMDVNHKLLAIDDSPSQEEIKDGECDNDN